MRGVVVLLLSVVAMQAALSAEPVTRLVSDDDVRAKLDLGEQVLKLDVGDLPIVYTYPPGSLPLSFDGFTPASVLIAKAKAFDDGLIAAVELAASEGLGDLPGRFPFIRDVERQLVTKKSTPETLRGLIGAALTYAEPAAELLPDWRDAAERELRAHRDPPHGVYTWTSDLRRVFQARRILQSKLDAKQAAFISDAIAADPELARRYDALIRFDARLFNRPKQPPITRVSASHAVYAFFPGGRSPEVEFAEDLYGGRMPPADFDPLDVLISEVRSGKRSLEPKPDSGWYDWIGWAQEPLLTFDRCPERKKVEPNDNYRALLVELFRGAYVQARESLTGGVVGGVLGGVLGGERRRSIHIRPDLTLEPLPTFYERRARAYEFIASVLTDAFGEDGFKQLRRVYPDGSRGAQALPDELAAMVSIFRGATALAAREVGLAAPDDAGEHEIERFETWRRALTRDADVGRDARAMVPVFYDAFRNKTKVWMFLGWHQQSATIDFGRRPAITIVPDDPNAARQPAPKPEQDTGTVDVYFESQRVTLYRPVVATAYVDQVLDRDAFRALCAKYPTTDALLAHLNDGSTSK